jgi:hypothetical protein
MSFMAGCKMDDSDAIIKNGTIVFKWRRLTLVGTTGFEPAASCTPCKRATGLRYVPKFVSYVQFLYQATSSSEVVRYWLASIFDR